MNVIKHIGIFIFVFTSIGCSQDRNNLQKELFPKKMVLDKPFVLFLKSRNSDVPYFAAYLTNTELLELIED